MSIFDKVFTYIYNKENLTPEILQQYQNSLIFIGKDRQIYQPLTNTYIGISKEEFDFLFNDKVISTNDNTSYYITFANTLNGYSYSYVDQNLHYNPYKNVLFSNYFEGVLEPSLQWGTITGED